MENKNNSIQYSVNDKTVRCIDLLKKIVTIQEKTLAYFISEGIEDSKEAEIFAESIGNAVKAFGGVLPEGIYSEVIGVGV